MQGVTVKNRILLATSIDVVGLPRLPEVFANGGIEVTVASGAGLAITRSRFVSKHIRTERSPEQVREGLEDHVTRFANQYDRVIIADEPLLRTFLSRPAASQLSALAPMLADPEHLVRCLSKVSFTVDAQQAGIPVPRFHILAGPEHLSESSWPSFPFVAKSEESMSGSGVRLIHSASELHQAKTSMGPGPIVVQEFISGQVGATSALFSNGKPLCWFSYYLRDNWPNPLAAASTLEFCWHPQVETMLNQLGSLTGFDGLCGVDWVLDSRTGDLLVLEMNMRPTPGIYLSHHAGVSFSAALAAWVRREDSVQKPRETQGQSCRMFPQHLHWAIDKRNLLRFLSTFGGAPWRDPALLLAQTRRVLTHYAPTSLRGNMNSILGR